MAINKTINKSSKTHAAMRNCIEYVLKEEKTYREHVAITGPYEMETVDYDSVYQSFIREKNTWGKDSGRMYAHNIISWHKDETITKEEALSFGVEFAENYFAGFQTLVVVHHDREHLHVHLVTNTVSYLDGHKLHQSKWDLEEMKKLTNRMCEQRKLSVTEKGKRFSGEAIPRGEVISWDKNTYQMLMRDRKSYVFNCGMAVAEAIEVSNGKEAFMQHMSDSGWEVIWKDNKKHITFVNSEGKRVRDSNLSKLFNMEIDKEGLENEFVRKKAGNGIEGNGKEGYPGGVDSDEEEGVGYSRGGLGR